MKTIELQTIDSDDWLVSSLNNLSAEIEFYTLIDSKLEKMYNERTEFVGGY